MSDINKLRNRVNSLAQGMFEDTSLTEEGNLIIAHDSTALILNVDELQDDMRTLADNFSLSKSFVDIRAIVLGDVKVSKELTEYVACFGPTDLLPGVTLYLAMQDNGLCNVIACTVLSADDLDERELRTGLLNVALTAGFLDDEMQKEYGGKRMADN